MNILQHDLTYGQGQELIHFLLTNGYLPAMMGFTGTKEYDIHEFTVRAANGLKIKTITAFTDDDEYLHSTPLDYALSIHDFVAGEYLSIHYKHGLKHCLYEPAYVSTRDPKEVFVDVSHDITKAVWYIEGKEYSNRQEYLDSLSDNQREELLTRILKGDTFLDDWK